jgi:hypothetical protein
MIYATRALWAVRQRASGGRPTWFREYAAQRDGLRERGSRPVKESKVNEQNILKKRLRDALVATGCLQQGQDVPSPWQCSSGVAGKSQVWFVCLPGPTPRSLVAKFDTPDRAAVEWNAIECLRRNNTPVHAMLPIPGNKREHGVVIYEDIAGQTLSGHVWTLKELLAKQLASNQKNCLTAFEELAKTLALFYAAEPGAARFADQHGGSKRWLDIFPRIEQNIETIREAADRAWNDKDLAQFKVREWTSCARDGQRLPSPTAKTEEILKTSTGRIVRSRIHGDLNPTNVLVGMTSGFAPGTVFVIDLAASESDAPTAIDLARLESEFWHGVFADQQAQPKEILEQLVLIHNWLNGHIAKPPQTLSSFAAGAQAWLHELRRRAQLSLQLSQKDYCLLDYNTVLYFTHLQALAFRTVKESPIRRHVVLLCAALSRQFITDCEAGLFCGAHDGRPVASAAGTIDVDPAHGFKLDFDPELGAAWAAMEEQCRRTGDTVTRARLFVVLVGLTKEIYPDKMRRSIKALCQDLSKKLREGPESGGPMTVNVRSLFQGIANKPQQRGVREVTPRELLLALLDNPGHNILTGLVQRSIDVAELRDVVAGASRPLWTTRSAKATRKH